MEQIDYTIGDDIVAMATHTQYKFRKGTVYTALALRKPYYNCVGDLVDIGIKAIQEIGLVYKCRDCGASFVEDGIWWMYARNFKKLDTLVNIDELKEVLEKPAFS